MQASRALIALLSVAVVAVSAPAAVSGQCPECGDVNCDGSVDVIDALLAFQTATGMRADLPCATSADVSRDAEINPNDALLIVRRTVGLEDAFTCNPVVTSLTPRFVGAFGGDRVRVTGAFFAPGVYTIADQALLPSTYLDCASIEITTLRHRPGSVELEVFNPDGGYTVAPENLEIEGVFRDVTAEAGLDFVPARGPDLLNTAGGVAVGDYDGDDELDIFVPNNEGANALFRALGDGTFVNVASSAGVADPEGNSGGACFGDYDNDGDLDLYVTSYGPNRFYRNEGDGSFVEMATTAGVSDNEHGTGCSWGDYDRDGFLDLYVANHLDESDISVFVTRQFDSARRTDRLFHNLADGTFEDATGLLDDATGAGFGASFVDYDNDGDSDLYLANDFGSEILSNVLWRNDGMGPDGWSFTNVSSASGAALQMFGMGLAIGDYDADGFLDFYLTNIGRNQLLHSKGDGTFENRTDYANVARERISGNYSVGWGAAFLDYDNNGALDLYLVAGYLDTDPLLNEVQQANALFRNRGDGRFEDVSDVSGADDDGIGRGVTIADFNHDGFLDVVFVDLGQKVVMLQNTARFPGHWLEVETVGTRSNRNGIGARITAVVGEQTLIREVIAGGSSMSQNALEVHFGLGAAEIVDTLRVDWPSGVHQTLSNVAVDRRLKVVEP